AELDDAGRAVGTLAARPIDRVPTVQAQELHAHLHAPPELRECRVHQGRVGREPGIEVGGGHDDTEPERHRRGSVQGRGHDVVLLVSGALAAKPAPSLPSQIPARERAWLQEVAEGASVSARAAGEPFLARADVFEFLLDHPEFATHVTRALKLARYRIWRGPE